MSKQGTNEPQQQTEFEQLSSESQMSLASEFLVFVRENKKWWLIPLLLVFSLISLLLVLGSSGAAPFIYTLF